MGEEIIYKCQEGTPTKYEANSVEEAISAGLTDLKATRAQVDVQVISNGKKGFLGIGKQLAAVEITVKAQKPAPNEEVKTESKAKNSAKTQDKESSKVGETKTTQPQNTKEQSVSSTNDKKTETNMTKDDKEKDADFKATAKKEAASTEPEGPSFEDVLVELGNYLAEVTKNMGISATINVTPEKHTVYYDFETEQEGLLIGKRGKNLNSLQLLAQDFLDKRVRRRVRVILDVANYRDRRAETLSHLAQKTARDAIAAGKPITLDPMPALERKVIHTSLAENEYVETYSRGNEPRRAVVVDPQ